MGKRGRNGFWQIISCSFLVLLLVCQVGLADNKKSNEPNEPVELADNKKSKEPNEPNEPNQPVEPVELLKFKWEAVVSILQNKDIEQDVKEKKINKILKPLFDFPLMAKLSLGREHWPKLNDSQREEFTDLFSERLKISYGKKIALYQDQKVVFKPKKQKNNTCQIPTELINQDKKVAILYKLRKVEKNWKIYDVEIQGVSVLLTYRSQFDEILNRGTVKELLERLKQPPDD